MLWAEFPRQEERPSGDETRAKYRRLQSIFHQSPAGHCDRFVGAGRKLVFRISANRNRTHPATRSRFRTADETTVELDVPEDATSLTLALYCVRANFKVRQLSISDSARLASKESQQAH